MPDRDFLNAWPIDGGLLCVEMSPNAAACLHHAARHLLAALDGHVKVGPLGRRRFLAAEDLFPDGGDEEESRRFRERYGETMFRAVTDSVRRVATAWHGQPVFTLDRAHARDWMITFAHAPSLHLGRRWGNVSQRWFVAPASDADVTLNWMTYARHEVASAIVRAECAVSLCEPPVSGT